MPWGKKPREEGAAAPHAGDAPVEPPPETLTSAPMSPTAPSAVPSTPDTPAMSAMSAISAASPAPTATGAEGSAPGDATATLREIQDQIAHLAQAFDVKLKYDASKETQVERLYQELDPYKKGFVFNLLRPILTDLMSLRDDLEQLLRHHEATLPENFATSLREYLKSMLDAMRRNGLEAFQDESTIYNSERQRINQVVATADPAADRTIAARVRPGFAYEGRVVRPELVDVYRAAAQ